MGCEGRNGAGFARYLSSGDMAFSIRSISRPAEKRVLAANRFRSRHQFAKARLRHALRGVYVLAAPRDGPRT